MRAFLVDHLLHALETLAEALAVGLALMAFGAIGLGAAFLIGSIFAKPIPY